MATSSGAPAQAPAEGIAAGRASAGGASAGGTEPAVGWSWWADPRSRPARLPPLWWALLAGGCVLAVTGLFGGLAEAQSRSRLPSAGLGTAVDAGPWTITVTAVRVANSLPGVFLEKPKDRWVYVVATVEAEDEPVPSYQLARGLTLHGVAGVPDVLPDAGIKGPQVVLGRDSGLVDRLQPGLPERIGFFWEQPGDRPVPAEVDVTVTGLTYRKNGFTHIFEWLDPAPVSRILRVPVEDRRSG